MISKTEHQKTENQKNLGELKTKSRKSRDVFETQHMERPQHTWKNNKYMSPKLEKTQKLVETKTAKPEMKKINDYIPEVLVIQNLVLEKTDVET